ncbi:hypothetical protein Ancab_037143 [Ancistrocladus abbreviatus]
MISGRRWRRKSCNGDGDEDEERKPSSCSSSWCRSSYLPPELCALVLSALPFKSVLRFRCVCKSWCSLINSPHFALRFSMINNKCKAGVYLNGPSHWIGHAFGTTADQFDYRLVSFDAAKVIFKYTELPSEVVVRPRHGPYRRPKFMVSISTVNESLALVVLSEANTIIWVMDDESTTAGHSCHWLKRHTIDVTVGSFMLFHKDGRFFWLVHD